ncbi:MAG: nitrogen regulation protein NR(I) [Candidatus Nitrotoga sp.]|nr:nitrogen regulation protein NR(I) [Candidatus Nitrotoga sp.]
MKPVWIVDDDSSIRWVLEKALERAGIDCVSLVSADEALIALQHKKPQVVISDIRMPGSDGLDFLKKLQETNPGVPVIIMTAHSDLENAVSAFQGGAFDYLPKPFDVHQAVALVRRALEQSLRTNLPVADSVVVSDILGQAPTMQEVFRTIGRLVHSHATVMINGESGTGKELVAHALHRHGPRSKKPFVAINTAAIPRGLLESELFGHERGAFTGAASSQRGRFEQAEGGTLFLDEIGDMPADLQTRLLRVLSDGSYYRVGGQLPIKTNVRIITATHQNLEERVKEGLFRDDLFHRLNVIRLLLPPLRERRDDIPLLSRHFLEKKARELSVRPKEFSKDAMHYLEAQNFPGNVRQLENLCHWLTVMTPSQRIEISDLPLDWRERSAPTQSANDWLSLLGSEVDTALERGDKDLLGTLGKQFERVLIERALRHTGDRRIEAANLLGMGRNTITRKIHDLGFGKK